MMFFGERGRCSSYQQGSDGALKSTLEAPALVLFVRFVQVEVLGVPEPSSVLDLDATVKQDRYELS